MNALNWIVLAQRSRMDNLSDSFKTRGRVDNFDLLYGLVFVLVLVIGIWLLSRWTSADQRRGSYSSPLWLFLSLSKAHGLAWSDRLLLWRLARSKGLTDPARVFLEPEQFDESALDESLLFRAGRLRQLRAELFAEPPTEKPADAQKPEAALPGPGPLLPATPSPALDIPPWTGAPSADVL